MPDNTLGGNFQGHASQLREVRAYVRRRWPKAEVTEYLDRASGARFSREGLDALMAEVRQGRLDVLAVYKLDRLGRSLQHLAQLIGEFEAHGTALVATSQGIDTSESNPRSARSFACDVDALLMTIVCARASPPDTPLFLRTP